LLLPNYDSNADGFRDVGEPAPVLDSFLPDRVPVVPLDCRPHLTFGRPMNDPAKVGGVNTQPVVPEWEQIGDPTKDRGNPLEVRYILQEVELHKHVGDGWSPVARKAAMRNPNPPPAPDWVLSPNPPGLPDLFGSWAPVPAMPDGGGQNVGQTKLWLWSKTPFDYTRHSGRAWDDWF